MYFQASHCYGCLELFLFTNLGIGAVARLGTRELGSFFIQQRPGFGGGLLLSVLFPCYFWPSLLGQMLLHCFTESCKVRRSRYRQLEVSQQALKYGSWRRRTEDRECLLPNTLYLKLCLPSTFGLKWALGLLLILSITNLKFPQMVIVLSC